MNYVSIIILRIKAIMHNPMQVFKWLMLSDRGVSRLSIWGYMLMDWIAPYMYATFVYI